MNKNIFIIIIAILVFQFINLSNKKKSLENMQDCSLNDKTILENPIFKDLEKIKNKNFYKYITDFDNNVIDDKILIFDILEKKQITLLKNIINSYNITNYITNITIHENNTIQDIKNIILKNIILNHLSCFGDQDPELFWIKLHLINKQYKNINTNLHKDTIIESFKLFNNNTYKNKHIISFTKHQNNILLYLFDKHQILKDIPNSINLILNNKLDIMMLDILNYLVNLDEKNVNYKSINMQLKNLYIDLRELTLINQIMINNPDYQFGYSENNKTFILNHKLLLDNHKDLYKSLMLNTKSFELLYDQHTISKSNKNIRNVFLLKLQTYLKYNGIKLSLDSNNYKMLNINSIDLRHVMLDNNFNIENNLEYITSLNNKLNNKLNNDVSFRIKKSNLFESI